MRLFGAALLLALASCGAVATHQGRDEWGALIGMGLPDLLGCAGVPDHVQRTGPGTLIAQWDNRDAAAGLKVTTPLFGSIEVGAGASCSMVATVLRDGTVVDLAFPRAVTTLGGGPYAGCAVLVQECLVHPSDTGPLAGYDAFGVLLPGEKSSGGKP